MEIGVPMQNDRATPRTQEQVETTVVLRRKASGVEVTGPATFRGGCPVPHARERDGISGEWCWDGRRLHARVDHLGMFPLYYAELPDGLAVSTGISGLLKAGVSPHIDWAALQILFFLGFGLGCDTAFRAIRAFPVGGVLTWTPERLEVREQFPEIRPNSLSRPAAIDGFLELFRSAVRKRIVAGAPIHLPLSGGRDSRHILLELIAAGAKPACCYTSPFLTMRNDVLVARAVCAALGVAHAEANVPEDLIATELKKNECIAFQALEHGWTLALAQTMAHPEAVSYDGIAGDVLSAGHFHDEQNSRLYRQGRFEELARRLAPQPQLPLLPARWREAVAAADPRQPLIRELLRYRHTHNPMMFFYLWNRSRRAVSPTIQGLYGRFLRAVYAPFLDRDVFDFLSGLPEEMFADKQFHTQAIARAFPEVAAIPFASKTPISRPLSRRYALSGLRFLLGAPASPLLDRQGALLRFARSLVDPRHAADAYWVLHQAVMLCQLGRL
jgi:asparagine synthetase B (glutamine-hydrolysing)